MSTSSPSVNGFLGGAGGTAKNSKVPIGHLDYDYVRKCSNAKELEEIINVLRSGSEGYYPDLVGFTEAKLKEVDPKSTVLRQDNPVHSYSDLDKESRREVADDLRTWMNQVNSMDSKLKNISEKSEVVNKDSLPPVRSSNKMTKPEADNAKESNAPSSKKTVKPRDYREWDKLDINKELEEIDKKGTSGKVKDVKNKNLFEAEPISTKDLKAEERQLRAVREKEKGNEAFNAKDYEEAIVYYTNSLSYEPMAASYNNRAAAELKVEKYTEAIVDCNKVLELEPNNIKAYLRRGMAFKALKQYQEASKDFNSMLTLDGNNKRAKELLAEIEKIERPHEPVHETKVDTLLGNDIKSKDDASKNAKKKGQRLKIIEVESTEDSVGDVVRPSVEGTGDDSKVGLDDQNRVVKNGLEARKSKDAGDATAKDPGISVKNIALVDENSQTSSSTNEVKDINSKITATTLQEPHAKPAEVTATEKAKVSLELPVKVKSLMEEGNKLYKTGHYAEALQKYSKCVKHLWKDREAYSSAVSSLLNNKAACYLKMGDCKQCIKECDLSLELISDNVRVLIRRGMAYETMEKYAEAFRDFNRVRLLDGSNKLAQQHCSRVIKHLEMLHGKSWRKEIFEMSNSDEKKPQTFLNTEKNKKDASDVHLTNSKETEKASATQRKDSQLEPSRKALPKKTVPESVEKINHKEEIEKTKQEQYLKLKDKGNLLVKQGKHQEAINHYTDCIKLCPQEVAVYTNRALCYLQLNKYELAEEDCNHALKIQANNIKALFRRAKARKGMRRFRESSEDLVMVLKLDAKNGIATTELSEVLQLLKKEKERKDTEKPATSKRKRILIKDIEGDDGKLEKKTAAVTKDNVSTSEGSNKSNVVKKENIQNSSVKKTSKEQNTVAVDHVPEQASVAKDKNLIISQTNNESNAKKETVQKSSDKNVKKDQMTASVEHSTPDQTSTPVAKDANISKSKGNKEAKEAKVGSMQNSANKITKEQGVVPVQHNVKTAFQFHQTWKCVKNGDTMGYLNVLKQVNLDDLPKVISNRLDADMLRSMFQALHLEVKTKGDLKFVCHFLQKLHCVERFEMTLLFQSQEEKKAVSALFNDVVKQNEQIGMNTEDLAKLRHKYRA